MRRQVRPGVAFMGTRLNRVHLANTETHLQTLNRSYDLFLILCQPRSFTTTLSPRAAPARTFT